MTVSLLVSAALAQHPARLDPAIRPRSQAVALTVDPAVAEYTGRTEIVLDIPASTRSVTLHADELTLGQVVVRKGKREIEAVATPLEHGLVRIDTQRALKRGTWTVEIAFEGTLHDETYGLYRFERQGQWYVVSQFEADDARTAWPCFDEPGFKIPLQVSVDVPAGLIAVSNAPIESERTEDGVRSVVFETTPPIPMYAAALAVGPYVATPVEGLPSTIWTVQGQEAYTAAMREAIPSITAWLTAWFGSPPPYPKLDVIAVPEFTFDAMENPGAIVIDASYLALPETQTEEHRQRMVHVVAHEFAHLWFGDWVTLAWWDDLWLNESFADWVALRAAAELEPESRGEMDEVAAAAVMIEADGRASVQALRTEVDPTAVFETVNFAVYAKGRQVLDTAEAWIGAEPLQQGLRAYLAARPFGTAEAEDLFDALSAASRKDVKGMMLPYLDTPGAPRIAFERLEDGRFRLSQRRYAVLGNTPASGGPWVVPMRMRIGRPGGKTELVTAVVEGPSVEVDLGEVEWILPAAEGVGYYAWSLPPDLRAALIAAAPALTAPERLRIVDAIRLELEAGDVGLGEVLASVPSFAAESDPRVVEAVVRLAEQIRLVERLDDPALEARANAWRREQAQRWLTPLGLEPVAGEAADRARLRVQVLTVLAHAQEPKIREHGRAIGERFLADSASVPPDLGAWGLGILPEDTPTLQPRLLERLARETDPAMRSVLLRAIGQVGGEAALATAREAALAPELTFDDLFAVLDGIRDTRSREADLDEQLAWTLANHEALIARIPPVFRPFVAYVDGCSLERLERARAFFLDPSRVLPGTEQTLGDSADTIHQCRLEVETHRQSLAAFLGQTAAASSGAAP